MIWSFRSIAFSNPLSMFTFTRFYCNILICSSISWMAAWPAACSFGWWLMAGANLFWEKSTAGWLLMADLFWEKITAGWWLISQANRARIDFFFQIYANLIVHSFTLQYMGNAKKFDLFFFRTLDLNMTWAMHELVLCIEWTWFTKLELHRIG
jgi:hypothetical protein